MHTLKLIGLTIVLLVRQVWLLPRTLMDLSRQKRLSAARSEREADRLDRIRNPSRYRGK